MHTDEIYDAVVIGGGFFGLSIADYIHEYCGQARVLVLEKESDFMQRASYNNQARVHGGYHYPRSLLTGLRSQVNFTRFVDDYRPAIVSDFNKYYAVAHNFSKISSHQFRLFCERIGATINPAPKHVKSMFEPKLIEDVFRVTEYAFDSNLLKKILVSKLDKQGISLLPGVSVGSIHESGDMVNIRTDAGQNFSARQVFNCTYSLINHINKNSDLPLISLKHELAEMCLVKLPSALDDIFVTVMCGPFFSYMPFPDRQLATLSHVRYTPHSEWHDQTEEYRHGHDYLDHEVGKVTHFPQMHKDAMRYIPALKDAEYVDSLWEVKTILPQSEDDDSRPILFRRDHGINGYNCVMGGKLDNIYDAFRELDFIYDKA